MTAGPVDLSVIIVNWNTRELLSACLASVYETLTAVRFEVWVVDNGSTDGSAEAVQTAFPEVNLLANTSNLGFAAANNQALDRMTAPYALLLNTDTVLTAGAVDKLMAFMADNDGVGMACGQLLNKDGSLQNSVANFPGAASLIFNETLLRLFFPGRFPSKRRRIEKPLDVESCIGACLMVKKSAIAAVGPLDAGYFFFFEETDWALRMQRAGWRVCFVPQARIFHLQGQSVGHNLRSRLLFFRSRYRYLKKWHPRAYPLYYGLVFLRLLVNNFLNLTGWVVTLGLNAGIRKKLWVYTRLLAWHLKGCPDPGRPGEGN